jgi:hypothetical protein
MLSPSISRSRTRAPEFSGSGSSATHHAIPCYRRPAPESCGGQEC